MKKILFPLLMITFAFGCSKSGGSNGGGGTGGTGSAANGTGLIPLKQGNVWNYRLKNYNVSTGAVTDSSNFTLTVSGTTVANGATYYKLVNSLDNSVLLLSDLTSSTIGSIDSVGGVNFYTAFVTGSGDSLQSVNSWPATVSTSCTGTSKLYAYYADTTLVNLDGTVYSSSQKNDVVTFDCSSNKVLAQVYFIKQGVGLVRYAQYIYGSGEKLELQAAWVLESESLQ
jgi:hypothetical protein